jgi:hypothetical protein
MDGNEAKEVDQPLPDTIARHFQSDAESTFFQNGPNCAAETLMLLNSSPVGFLVVFSNV